MTTYRELVYSVLDSLKLVSDDSHFVEEHVLFLLDKYRSFILKRHYSDIRKEIPSSNYQTICLDLEEAERVEGIPCVGSNYMKSTQKIPDMMTIGSMNVTAVDYFSGNFAYVSNERFKYVGYNSYLRNQIYATIAPSNYLYMRSNNPQMYYLEKVKVTGIFENASKAAELECDKEEEGTCDVMDMRYPLEEGLIPTVVELIVKELGGQKYAASDSSNNANDDLSDLAAYIRQQFANGRRSDLYKDYS